MASQVAMVVYGTPTCVMCEKTKYILTNLGIPFEFKDLDSDPDAKAEFAMNDYDPDYLPAIVVYNVSGVEVRKWDGRVVADSLYKAIVEAQIEKWKPAKSPEKKRLTGEANSQHN